MKKLVLKSFIVLSILLLSYGCSKAYAESENAIKINAKKAAEIMECVPSKRWNVCICFLSSHRWWHSGSISMAIDQSGKACKNKLP